MEEALSTKVQEAPKKFEPAVTESLQTEDLKELAPPTPVTPSPEEEVQEEKGKEVQQGILKPQVGFVVRDSVKDSLRVRGGRAGDVSHIVSIPESISKETEKLESAKETTLYLKSPLKLAAEQPIQSAEERTELFQVGDIRYYELDKNQVRKLTEKDTLIEADTLKKVISSWSEFFDKKPETEWLLEGFSQIKIAYQLLLLKSKDDSLLDEAIKLLNQYEESAVEQKTKDELNKLLAELEALRKK